MIDENKKTIFNSELLTCIYKYLFLKIDIYIIELNKITFIPKDIIDIEWVKQKVQ